MRISITGKNIEVSEYLNDLAIKKVSKLERYFNPDTEAIVTMGIERNRHIVEVTIPSDGVLIRAEAITGDMYASIDDVLSKLEKQIHKHRTKLERQLKAGAFKHDAPLYSETFNGFESGNRKVSRIKRFAVKPMTLDEAIMQMELLGHSFFVFFNADTEEVNVLYMRHDGGLGLIEPEFD